MFIPKNEERKQVENVNVYLFVFVGEGGGGETIFETISMEPFFVFNSIQYNKVSNAHFVYKLSRYPMWAQNPIF